MPMSVTLTALSRVPFASLMTATLLTPCSLMSFIASRTLLAEVAATTDAYRFKEGRERDWRGLERYCINVGVFSA